MNGRTYKGEHKQINPCCEAVHKIEDKEVKRGLVVRQHA